MFKRSLGVYSGNVLVHEAFENWEELFQTEVIFLTEISNVPLLVLDAKTLQTYIATKQSTPFIIVEYNVNSALRLQCAKHNGLGIFTLPVNAWGIIRILDQLISNSLLVVSSVLTVTGRNKSIGLSLSQSGIAHHSFSTHTELLDHIIEVQCDLVILDHKTNMNSSGLDCAISIRQLGLPGDIPIILLADNITSIEREKILSNRLVLLPRYVNSHFLSDSIKSIVISWTSSKHSILSSNSAFTYSEGSLYSILQFSIQRNAPQLGLILFGLERRNRPKYNNQEIREFILSIYRHFNSYSVVSQISQYEFGLVVTGLQRDTLMEKISEFKKTRTFIVEQCHIGVGMWQTGESARDVVTKSQLMLSRARINELRVAI